MQEVGGALPWKAHFASTVQEAERLKQEKVLLTQQITPRVSYAKCSLSSGDERSNEGRHCPCHCGAFILVEKSISKLVVAPEPGMEANVYVLR